MNLHLQNAVGWGDDFFYGLLLKFYFSFRLLTNSPTKNVFFQVCKIWKFEIGGWPLSATQSQTVYD